jgi:hypothetical protein
LKRSMFVFILLVALQYFFLGEGWMGREINILLAVVG